MLTITSDSNYLHIGKRSIAKSNILLIDQDETNVYLVVSERKLGHLSDGHEIVLPFETTEVDGDAFASADALKAYLVSEVSMQLTHALVDYDLADGNETVDILFRTPAKYAIQAVWADVTGTINGTVKVQQSIDGVSFDQLKTIDAAGDVVDFGVTMSGAAGSATIEDKDCFTGKVMRLSVAVGTITGGTLNIYVNKIA